MEFNNVNEKEAAQPLEHRKDSSNMSWILGEKLLYKIWF